MINLPKPSRPEVVKEIIKDINSKQFVFKGYVFILEAEDLLDLGEYIERLER